MKKKSSLMILLVVSILCISVLAFTACNIGDSTKSNPKIVKQYCNTIGANYTKIKLYDDNTFVSEDCECSGYVKTVIHEEGTYKYNSDKELGIHLCSSTINRYVGDDLLASEQNNYEWDGSYLYTDNAIYFVQSPQFIRPIAFNNDNFGHTLLTEKLYKNVFTQNEEPKNLRYYRYFTDCEIDIVDVNKIDTSKLGEFYLNNNKDLKYYVTTEDHLIEENIEIIKKNKIGNSYQHLDENHITYYKGEKNPSIYLFYGNESFEPSLIKNFSTKNIGKFKMTIKHKNFEKTIPYEVIDRGIPRSYSNIFNYMVTYDLEKKQYQLTHSPFYVYVTGDSNYIEIANIEDYIEYKKGYNETVGITGADIVFKNAKGEVRYPILVKTYDNDHGFINQTVLFKHKDDNSVEIDVKNKTFKINGVINVECEDNLSKTQTLTISQDNVLDYKIYPDGRAEAYLKIRHELVGLDYYCTLRVGE